MFNSKIMVATIVAATLGMTPAPASASDWDGFYGGVHFGYGFGDSDATGALTGESRTCFIVCSPWTPYNAGLTDSFDMNGVFGGAQAGYNIRSNSLVFGLEADISKSDLSTSGSNALVDIFGGVIQLGSYSTSIDWYGTARARAGYLLDDNLLIYATGGLAFGDVSSSMGVSLGGGGTSTTSSDIQLGYAIGGGVESSAFSNMSIKLEYLYVDLGSADIFNQPLPDLNVILLQTRNNAAVGSADTAFHTLRVGVNIHFDSPL
jgi:outer membrane immunogenic protein